MQRQLHPVSIDRHRFAQRAVLLLLILCVGVAPASAQTSLRNRAGRSWPNERAALTLDSAIARALAVNPDLVTARLRIDSAHAERAIASGYPNPTVSATPGNPSQYGVQIPLDVGPARHFRVKVTSEGEGAARLDTRDVERQTIFAVRQAFFDILLADSLRSLAAEQADGFRRLLAADSARLRVGSIAERDIVTTRLQLAHAEATLARSEVQRHATRLALEALMASAPDTSLLISGSLAYRPVAIDADAVLALALARRPDLAAATMRVTQSSAALSLARANLLPMPVVGGVYQPAQPFASGSHYAPSVGITLPLLYSFRGERARAKASLAAATIATERARMQVRADVSQAFDSYLSARELADRYACGLLADATGALEAARYAYDRGASSLLDLLEAIRAYGDTRSDYFTASHDYWVSVFALERAAGEDFISEVR
jgi:outer membrane protein, heavy metal efflux system